ncbi:MAG: hypothetical protein HYZ09_00345, partial [Candidatus Kerfeldbacteria bacterium]|nr:hypothetical protein [Candidatus Kerfeldbacteria bacterium]
MVRLRFRCFSFGALLALVAGLAVPALAQTTQRWVALDPSPPGTPADVRLDLSMSDSRNSFFDVFIHGFWVEDKQGPDGRFYQKVRVPGLGSMDQVGAPELPAWRGTLACGLGSIRLVQSTPSDLRQLPGYLIWPQPLKEAKDHESGEPEVFARDEDIYRLTTPWPPTDGSDTSPVTPKLGPIMGGGVEAWLAKWVPSSGLLLMSTRVRLAFSHPEPQPLARPITRETGRLAVRLFDNWPAVAAAFPINFLFYTASFLFLYPTGYDDELQPLIDQKQARGFLTAEIVINPTGNTCASIEALIDGWYNDQPAEWDKYALMVGDTGAIPLCTAPTGDPTDDLYASVPGADLDEEIYLGRLSVDSEADCANQVGKILAYEDSPALFCCYDEALLVAHKEGAPGKYVGAHESVRTASYAVPPTFVTYYGTDPAATDAAVRADIDNGTGLV